MHATNSRQFRKTEEILLDREIAALRLVILLRLFFVFAMTVSTLFIGKSLPEKIITSVLCLLAAGTTVPFWIALRRRVFVKPIGLIGVGIDVAFLITMPFNWYFSVGGPGGSPAYMLKHPNSIALSYLLLIVHSLAGRPRYPLILTIGATLGGLITFVYALEHPLLQFSPDFVTHILGVTVSLEFWIINTVSYTGVGVLLSWHVGRINASIHRAVRQETDNVLLSRYFSPAIQQEILKQHNDTRNPFSTAGSRKTIAVLFSDLRGFTALSETLSPEEATLWLRQYHEVMVGILFKHGGTLDKFLGDGILATFGTPEPTGDEAARAVRAALDMRAALIELNQRRVTQGWPALRQGIGVHYGPAIVGNVGVPERLEYTVIGDTVNLASRIEGLCKALETDLLISVAVAERFTETPALFESVGQQEIRGRRQSIALWKVRETTPTVA